MKALIAVALFMSAGTVYADCLALGAAFEVCDLEGVSDAKLGDAVYSMKVEDRIHSVALPPMEGVSNEQDLLARVITPFLAEREGSQVFEIAEFVPLDCVKPSRAVVYRTDDLISVNSVYTLRDKFVLFNSIGHADANTYAEHDLIISQFGEKNGLRKDCDNG